MSLSKEPVNVLNKRTAEPSATSLEPGAHLEGSEPPLSGPQKRARRKPADGTSEEASRALDQQLARTTAREQKRAPGLIRRPTTEAMAEANRANSLKCTGPVTDVGKMNVRLNAIKHGIKSLVIGFALPELGEMRGDLNEVRGHLEKCFQPRDHFELLLLDQMVENRWRRRRVVRAESSMLAAQRLQFELKYAQKLAGEGRSQGAAGEARLAGASGLVALPDSPAKFNLILQCLRAAEEAVRQDGFGNEGLTRLEAVYGPDPGLAGAILFANYRQFREAGKEAVEDAPPDTSSRQVFLDMLAAEIACFEKLLELNETIAATLAEAQAGAQNALSESDTQRFTRYETFLDRQFERLVKLFNEWRIRHERI